MTITSRIKLALPSFLMGAMVALGAMTYASEPAHVVPTSKAGIHCETYTQAGDTFNCTKLNAEGDVTDVTTFLVSADSTGSLVYAELVPDSGTIQPEGHDISSDGTSSVSTDGDGVVDDSPSDSTDLNAIPDGSGTADTKEVLVETEEGLEDAGFWKSFTDKAVLLYDTSSKTLSEKYHEMFPPTTDIEPTEPDAVLQSESEAATEAVETPQATAPPLDHTVDEAEGLVVEELPPSAAVVPDNWELYANQLVEHESAHTLFKTEVHWLAMNMVFEARNQGDIGMDAVADVTIKRLDVKMRGDDNIYDVVTDPAEFTWYGDEVLDLLTMGELDIFTQAQQRAEELMYDYINGEWTPILASTVCTEGATHYHHVDITPNWQSAMEKDCGIIGDHHFWFGK